MYYKASLDLQLYTPPVSSFSYWNSLENLQSWEYQEALSILYNFSKDILNSFRLKWNQVSCRIDVCWMWPKSGEILACFTLLMLGLYQVCWHIQKTEQYLNTSIPDIWDKEIEILYKTLHNQNILFKEELSYMIYFILDHLTFLLSLF